MNKKHIYLDFMYLWIYVFMDCWLYTHPHLYFPPVSAVEGIKRSCLCVHMCAGLCVFVCERSHGHTIWCMDPKFGRVLQHSSIFVSVMEFTKILDYISIQSWNLLMFWSTTVVKAFIADHLIDSMKTQCSTEDISNSHSNISLISRKFDYNRVVPHDKLHSLEFALRYQ